MMMDAGPQILVLSDQIGEVLEANVEAIENFTVSYELGKTTSNAVDEMSVKLAELSSVLTKLRKVRKRTK